MIGVVPVFVINNHLPAFEQKHYTTAEICGAAEKTSGYESIDGAQRIGSLWRIYPRSAESRRKLLIQGFCLRQVHVEIKDTNPFLVKSPNGEEAEIPATKLIINNIPLSFSDDEILKAVKALGVSVRSKMIEERDRDRDGRLTRWKTGRRFIYIDIPKEPLPKNIDMGPFKAALYHKEQKKTTHHAECRRCLQKGHSSALCPNPIKCQQCYKDGHVAGDPTCSLVPDSAQESAEQGEADTASPPSTTAAAGSGDMATSQDTAELPRGRPVKRPRQGQTPPNKQSLINFPSRSQRSTSNKRHCSSDKRDPDLLNTRDVDNSQKKDDTASEDAGKETNEETEETKETPT